MTDRAKPRRRILAAALALATAALPACAPQGGGRSAANDPYVKAALAYQEGDRDRATSLAQTALGKDPDHIMARLLLGNIHRDRAEYAAAAEQYQRVSELDPYSYKGHYLLGLMYHLLGKLQEATVSYLQSLKLEPDDVRSNMNLGLVYTALGKPELGVPYSKKAYELDPQSPEAAANLAVVLDSAGQHDEAESIYRKALEMDSGRLETMLNLAGSLMAQKKYKDAAGVYERILQKNDSTLIRQRYGRALLLAGDTDAAIEQFNNALRQSGSNYEALNGLGEAAVAQYLKSSMLDESKRQLAVKYWQRSLSLNPDQPRISALVKEYTDKKLFP